MKILGIDPSLRSTGFGVIESKGNQLTALCHGHLKNPPTVLPSRCLVRIGDAMMISNPRQATHDEIVALLERAY